MTLTITEFAAESASPPPTVWLMCRQHAWETGTSFVGEGAIRYLLSDEAAPLRKSLVFKILPMMDPDGCARGGVRFNRNGYDLNRNWDLAFGGPGSDGQPSSDNYRGPSAFSEPESDWESDALCSAWPGRGRTGDCAINREPGAVERFSPR